jgi:hypothetical protein
MIQTVPTIGVSVNHNGFVGGLVSGFIGYVFFLKNHFCLFDSFFAGRLIACVLE